jgi:hypothetical protein
LENKNGKSKQNSGIRGFYPSSGVGVEEDEGYFS